MSATEGDSDLLMDVLGHSDVLAALHGESLTREGLERRLDVSSATCYRYTNRLDELDLLAESDDKITLTPLGETVANEVSTFERTVAEHLDCEVDEEGFVEILRHSPGLQTLSRRPLDRREVEERLEISNTTGYRITRSLQERGLIEKANGRYSITATGEEILAAVSTFESNVRTAVSLGPVLAALQESGPDVDLDAFSEATVTTIQGYTHSPQNRFLNLIDETEALRGLRPPDIAPFYLSDIQQRLADGMEIENILRPSYVADQIAEFPEEAIDVCNQPNATVYLHDDLWYSLVLFDDRIGIGVPDVDTGTVQAFVDTGSPAARAWAEAVYESYKAEAVHLPHFDPFALQKAIEKMSPTEAVEPERL